MAKIHDDIEAIAQNTKDLMAHFEFTNTKQLAKKADVGHGTIDNIIGLNANPTTKTLGKISGTVGAPAKLMLEPLGVRRFIEGHVDIKLQEILDTLSYEKKENLLQFIKDWS